MKSWKRFATVVLSAALLLLMTACDGNTSWKKSAMRAFLTGQGLSADHVSLLAELEVGGETTWISYAVDGAKECMIFYQDAGETPVQLICRYDKNYYMGAYGEDPDSSLHWMTANRIEREAFNSGKALLRLPADTDTFESYQSQRTKEGGWQELAVRDGTQYLYLLDQTGRLTGLRTAYNNEAYTISYLRLQAPAVGELPEIKIETKKN